MSTHREKPYTTIEDEDGSTFPPYVQAASWTSDPGEEPVGTSKLKKIDTVPHVRAAIRYLRAAKCFPVPERLRIAKSKDGVPYLVVCQTWLQKELFETNDRGSRPHCEALDLFHKAAFRFFSFRAPFPEPTDVPRYDSDSGYEETDEDEDHQQQVGQPCIDGDMDETHSDSKSGLFSCVLLGSVWRFFGNGCNVLDGCVE